MGSGVGHRSKCVRTEARKKDVGTMVEARSCQSLLDLPATLHHAGSLRQYSANPSLPAMRPEVRARGQRISYSISSQPLIQTSSYRVSANRQPPNGEGALTLSLAQRSRAMRPRMHACHQPQCFRIYTHTQSPWPRHASIRSCALGRLRGVVRALARIERRRQHNRKSESNREREREEVGRAGGSVPVSE